MPPLDQAGPDAAVVIDTAPNPEAAQPNAATTQAQTDGAEGGEGVPAAPKTFTQSELDDIVQKRVAKAEAKAERRVLRTLERVLPAQAPQQTAQPTADAAPRRDQFASDEAWIDAKVDWKLGQRDAKTNEQRQQHEARTLTQKTEGIYAQAEKLAGFDREAFDELPLTRSIVEALVDSDSAPQLMQYMTSHPDEVDRIAKLSPARQAAELGKLEAKLPTLPRAKTSQAPDPVNPTATGKTVQHDLASSSQADYEAARKKQGARWAR